MSATSTGHDAEDWRTDWPHVDIIDADVELVMKDGVIKTAIVEYLDDDYEGDPIVKFRLRDDTLLDMNDVQKWRVVRLAR